MTLNKEASITLSLADANALAIFAFDASKAYKAEGFPSLSERSREYANELHDLLVSAGYVKSLNRKSEAENEKDA